MVWIFVVALSLRFVLNATSSNDHHWWAFPLYMALFMPMAAVGVGGLGGCVALGVYIVRAFA
jgi:hypothetical protein